MKGAQANAGFSRRIAAIIYDSFLVLAIWMISTTLLVALLTDGEEIGGPVYQIFLYFEIGVFYIYFWSVKGQTLGMQVWKICTVDKDNQPLKISKCLIRFLYATIFLIPLGLGFLSLLLNREKLTWYDMASGTRVIYLGKNPYT